MLSNNYSNTFLGNEKIKSRLQKAIIANRVSHAYILDGPAGSGKTSAAKYFAKALQCLDSSANKPCGSCSSCRLVDSGNHPDVIIPVPEKSSDKKRQPLSVKDVREQLNENALIKPFAYPRKIFVIENADEMNPQAQNAFLKTLEEPPEYCVFLLLSSSYTAFLPTIISRCALLKLSPLPKNIIAKALASAGIKDAAFYAEYSQGLLGRALQMAESEGFAEMRGETEALAEKIYNGELDIDQAFDAYSLFDKYKNNARDVLEIMRLYFRNKLINTPLLQNPGKLLKKLEAIDQAAENLRQNANFQMTIEVMLICMNNEIKG